MKKVTYICDRCGTEFEEYNRNYRLSEDYLDYDDLEHHWKYLDLCGTCESDLFDFMRQRCKIDIPAVEKPSENFDLD